MVGQLRVAVIGSETRRVGTPLAYTVYRTSVNYKGLCYHRLIRFRHFLSFGKRVKLASNAARIPVKLPPKIWWSRKASLRPETVEARQVLLNDFMQQVSTRPLTPRSEERLLKLLQVGKFAPEEEEDRVINSRVRSKQQSATLTEPASDILDRNYSNQLSQSSEKEPQDSSTDEEESCPVEQAQNNASNVSRQRQDSEASTNPASSDDTKTQVHRSMSATSTPVLHKIRPTSMSMTSQNMERAIFGSSLDTDLLEEGGKDSIGSLSDFVSTPESHYFDQIKQCNASIEGIMDSSRKLGTSIHEKQTDVRPNGMEMS